MIGTLINESNSKLFLSAIPEDILPLSDVVVGVYDEESDTACGVLSAEAIGERMLAIRYIYVDENWRFKGAGHELMNTLIEVAQDIDADGLVCVHSRGNISDGISELLESSSFVKNERISKPIYGVYLSELHLPENMKAIKKEADVVLKPLSEFDKKKWQVAGEFWKKNKGPSEGLKAFEEGIGSFDQKLSFVALDASKNIAGFILGEHNQKGYEIRALSALGINAPNILYVLIDHVADILRKQLGERGLIVIRAEQKQAMDIIDHISNGANITLGETMQYIYEVSL